MQTRSELAVPELDTKVPASQSLKGMQRSAFLTSEKVPLRHARHMRSRCSVPSRFTYSPGSRIGRWSLVERLGRGAFGTTWRAHDDDGRTAALKVLGAPPGDELRALARICHPAVAGVLDAGGEPVPWLAMELAPGRPLSELLREQAFDPETGECWRAPVKQHQAVNASRPDRRRRGTG